MSIGFPVISPAISEPSKMHLGVPVRRVLSFYTDVIMVGPMAHVQTHLNSTYI